MEVLTKSREETLEFKDPEVRNKAVVLLLSGGVDSTTLLYRLVAEGYKVHPISFYYGQKQTITEFQ